MAEDLQNFIGGQWTDMSFDKRSELVNPSTGEVFATAPDTGAVANTSPVLGLTSSERLSKDKSVHWPPMKF